MNFLLVASGIDSGRVNIIVNKNEQTEEYNILLTCLVNAKPILP